MKLKHSRTYTTPIFWIFMILLIAILWYLFFTPTGAIRRAMITKYPKEALTSKLVQVKSENMTTVYTFDPHLYDENNKTMYFNCHNKNIWTECNKIGF